MQLIFISHALTDEPLAWQIATELETRGAGAWMGKGITRSTPEWEQSATEAIQKSDGVVLILSPGYVPAEHKLEMIQIRLVKKPVLFVLSESYSSALASVPNLYEMLRKQFDSLLADPQQPRIEWAEQSNVVNGIEWLLGNVNG